jgi:hypothetical protein
MTKRGVKLNVDDVVEIKRLILKNELTNQEIADIYDVSRTVISRIKSGKRWSNVIVDEKGNHVKEEIKPEQFTVEYKEDNKKEFKVNKDDITYKYRLQFVDEYFEFRNLKMRAKSEYDNNFIIKIYRNRGWLFNNEYDDFISEISLVVTETVMKFESNDKDFSWFEVDKDSKSRRLLRNVIYKAIDKRLLDYANQLNHNYIEQKDNVREYKTFEIGSTDELVVNSDSANEEAMINFLSDEHNHFYLKNYDYEASPFLRFFKDNYESLLTDEQIRFMNVMKFYVDADSSYTLPYTRIVNKPYTQSAITHNKRRIRERIETAYDEFLKNNENV